MSSNFYYELRAALNDSADDRPSARALVDFCEKHRLIPTPDHEVDLWGFGTAPVLFTAEDGVWWAHLADLVEPTGIPYGRLVELMCEEPDSKEADWAQYMDDDDEYAALPFVSGHFVLALFAGESPWRKEFMANLSPLFGHGLKETGHDAGPIGEELTRDLPSKEVARHQAWSGPAGALLSL